MTNKIVKFIKFNIAAVLAAQIICSPVAFASQNISIINEDEAKNEIILNENGKKMLKQDWNGMRFELSEAKRIGTKKIKAVDSEEYEKALENINFDLNLIGDYKVYFLKNRLSNYSNAMALSFKDDSVVVFGTYSKLSAIDVHKLATHELGHQVALKLMDEQKWSQYINIRGLYDANTYNNGSDVHSNRVQEIFAEDFRMICGDELAKQAEHINNSLQKASENQELVAFFNNLQ